MSAEGQGDIVRLEQVEVLAHIGVPEDERSRPQRLTISLTLWPTKQAPELHDDIDRAVNYAEVCDEVRRVVQSRRDRLIETLADALAQHLLTKFALRRITIELRKYILPDVRFVSVRVTRERPDE
jgi:dihydroneopterin aldolase